MGHEMRDELERLAATHGLSWIVALVSVAVSKAFSQKRETAMTVLRSLVASLLITFLIVENQPDMNRGALFISVALAAMLSDYIVEAVMGLGEKIKRDPSVLLKWFGGRK